MSTVTTVLFDLGGVFLDWDPRYLYAKLFGDDVEGMERFLAEVCTTEWHDRQDMGEPIAEACAELARAHPEQAELIGAWYERGEEMVRAVIYETVDLLSDLKSAGVPCYALSNMERENYDRRRVLYPFLEWFDGAFISGYEGVMKPDPRYFSLALDRFGLSASEVVFIDDRSENIDAAAAMGMATVWFRSAPALRLALGPFGLLPKG
jgi:2-haloacid dehalogenase